MRSILLAASLLAMIGATPALADDEPAPRPGVTLRAGQLAATATVEINVSDDAVAEPISLAPDLAYGVTDDLTVMVVHSSFLATGFRGAAGRGLCLTGDDAGCAQVYDSVGAEALYGVRRGPLAIALDGGVHALSFDRGWYVAKLGARVRYQHGKLYALTSPSLFVAMTERDDDDATTVDNADRIWLPVVVGYAVTRPLSLGAATGIKGPLQGWSDGWELAVGAVGQYQIDPRFGVGASLIFGRMFGGVEPDGVDYRWLQLWLSYTR